jgi:hypothetical protein
VHHAEAKAYILKKGFDKLSAKRFAALFLEPFVAAELNACAAFSFCMWETGMLEIVGAVLDMRAEFVLHLAFNPGTLKESGSKGTHGN